MRRMYSESQLIRLINQEIDKRPAPESTKLYKHSILFNDSSELDFISTKIEKYDYLSRNMLVAHLNVAGGFLYDSIQAGDGRILQVKLVSNSLSITYWNESGDAVMTKTVAFSDIREYLVQEYKS